MEIKSKHKDDNAPAERRNMKELETKVDFVLCGEAEIQAVVKEASVHDLQAWASQFSLEQINVIVGALSESKEAEKLFTLVKGLDKLNALEIIGHALNLKQLLELQSSVSVDPEQAWKLFPIFVAVPHALFSQMLLEMSDKHKKELQNLCASEAIQHHLFLFTHELKLLLEANQQELQQLQAEIQELDVFTLSTQFLSEIKSRLRIFRHNIQQTNYKIENALLLAWNANSIALIESLSVYRERFENFLFTAVGHPYKDTEPSSGIFKRLDESLNVVFNRNKIEALDDSEPAIEALASLKLWYVEDYWHVGLLPKVFDSSQITLPLLNRDVSLQAHYRHEVEQNLHLLGLKTVKDFKRNHLVSKILLRDFVVANQKKITG